eukprot:1151576-Pelagomonas_calceolata.AAC.2
MELDRGFQGWVVLGCAAWCGPPPVLPKTAAAGGRSWRGWEGLGGSESPALLLLCLTSPAPAHQASFLLSIKPLNWRMF